MHFVRVFLVLAVATCLALCVVWQGAELRGTGRRLEHLQREIETLKTDEQKYRAEIERLKGPQRIISAAVRLGLEQASAPAPARPAHAGTGAENSHVPDGTQIAIGRDD